MTDQTIIKPTITARPIFDSEKHWEFTILGIPPSVNHCYGLRCIGKRAIKYPTKKMKEYKEFVKLHIPEHLKGKKPFTGPVFLKATFMFNDQRRRDLDNCFKVLQDALKDIAYGDDSQIHYLIAEKMTNLQAETSTVHIIVEEL